MRRKMSSIWSLICCVLSQRDSCVLYQVEDQLSITEPSKASDKYCTSTKHDGDATENEDDSDCSSSDHGMSGEDEHDVGDVETDDKNN